MQQITDQIHKIIKAHTRLVLRGASADIANNSTTEAIRQAICERDKYLLGKAYTADIDVTVKNLARGLIQVDQETKNIMRSAIRQKMEETL